MHGRPLADCVVSELTQPASQRADRQRTNGLRRGPLSVSRARLSYHHRLTVARFGSPTRDERYFAFVHDGDVVNKSTEPALKVRFAVWLCMCCRVPLFPYCHWWLMDTPELLPRRILICPLCRVFNSTPRSEAVIRTSCGCRTVTSR